MLGAQVAVPAHVERHLPDAPPLDEVGRQVRRAVGDDRDAQLNRRHEAADVARRLRVRLAQRRLDALHVLLRPAREVVVDRLQELERRAQADVGDRRVRAADEVAAVEEELERVERLGERRLGVALGLRLELVARLRGRHLAGVLREAEGRVRRPRDQRIEGADQVEVRVVDHRPLARIGRVELVEAVLVAEVRADRAALAHRAARKTFLLEHRRQVRRVLGEELGLGRLAPDVHLLEVEPGGAHEDPSREVVHARGEDVQGVGGHAAPPSRGSWASGRRTATRASARSCARSRRRGGRGRCCSRRARPAACAPPAAPRRA